MPTTQSYLDAVVYSNDVYKTNFQPVINAFTSPRCPGSYEGKPDYYDMSTNKCHTLPLAAFTEEKLAANSGRCGAGQAHGGPFKLGIEVDGNLQCFDTNTAPTSSWYPFQALNTQQIPVRPDDINAGGGYCGSSCKNTGYGPSSWRR